MQSSHSIQTVKLFDTSGMSVEVSTNPGTRTQWKILSAAGAPDIVSAVSHSLFDTTKVRVWRRFTGTKRNLHFLPKRFQYTTCHCDLSGTPVSLTIRLEDF